MQTLYLMRHGQTLFNQLKKIQGWCDAPLTELGIQQAKIAGEYFKDNHIELESAYSSTAERASDTLELITDLPYKRLKGIKERGFGRFEGEPEFLNPKLPYGDFFVPYGGEGEQEFQDRVVQTIGELMANDAHETILAVAHGAVCASFMRYWTPEEQWHRFKGFTNCSILKFTYDEGRFDLQEVINHDFSAIM